MTRALTTAAFVALAWGCADGGAAASGPKTTATVSAEVGGAEARRAFLEPYIGAKPYADLGDAPADSAVVFSVHHRDNSGGMIPGPSDWSDLVVARVPPDSLDAWREGMPPTEAPGPSRLRGLPDGPPTDGVTERYGWPHHAVGLDRRRGVVVLRWVTT